MTRLTLACGLILCLMGAGKPEPSPVERRPSTPPKVIEAYKLPYASVQVQPNPAKNSLAIRARLRILPPPNGHSEPLRFLLPAGSQIQTFTLDEQKAPFVINNQTLSAPVPADLLKKPRFVAALAYTLHSNAPNAEKPGPYCAPDGLLLPTDVAWLPSLPDSKPGAASIHIQGPAGWPILGLGGKRDVDASGTTNLELAEANPPGAVGGPWHLTRLSGADVYTASNAPPWIAVAERVLKLLPKHGIQLPPNPRRLTLFEPPDGIKLSRCSDTLAASQPDATLSTYLAHRCFGLLASQNQAGTPWLTHSLMAYLCSQSSSIAPAPAQEAQLEAYLNFLSHTPERDQPLLSNIPTRAWEGVILQKGLLIWSLLHRDLGDAAFWNLVKNVFQASRTGAIPNILNSPEFDSVRAYLTQAGLPRPRLENISITQTETGYLTRLDVTQKAPFFKMPVEVALICEKSLERTRFQSFANRIPLAFVTLSRPLRVVLDPGERIPMERRTHLRFTDALRWAPSTIVYGTLGTPSENQAMRNAAALLKRKVALEQGLDWPIRADHELSDTERHRSLWLIGRPETNAIAQDWVNQYPVRYLDQQTLWWQGRTWRGSQVGVVQMIANPLEPAQSAILLSGTGPETFKQALQHLQRPSTYCVFERRQILAEGQLVSTFPDPGTNIALY